MRTSNFIGPYWIYGCFLRWKSTGHYIWKSCPHLTQKVSIMGFVSFFLPYHEKCAKYLSKIEYDKIFWSATLTLWVISFAIFPPRLLYKAKGWIRQNEGSYLKIELSWDLFSKQNIFMTMRDMKNPKLALCRGRLGLFFMTKFWSTLVDQACEKFVWR